MGDERGSFALGDRDEVFSDERPCERGAQGILPLVHRVRGEGGEDILLGELAAGVHDVGLRPEAVGLLLDGSKGTGLSNIDGQRDHVKAAVLQPPNRNGGVQSSRIGQNHFVPRHGRSCPNQSFTQHLWVRI